jgi:anaerobic selenocysteine-containing dehydrogenase
VKETTKDKEKEGMDISRRSFVKTTAGALAGAATVGAAGAVGADFLPLLGASDGMFKEAHAAEASTKTVTPGLCHSCHFARCSLNYTVEDGVLTEVEGNPDGPWNEGKCCVRGQAAPAFVYNPYRVKTPMIRTNPEKGLDVDPGWVEIGWDEAIGMLAEKMAALRADDSRKLVWMHGFPTFYNLITGMYGIVPATFGTPNTGMVTGALCSVHLSNSLVQGGFAQYPDFAYGRYILAVGGTSAPNIAPGDGATSYIVDALKNGARMVVVDPRCSPEAELGEWQPIRPGTDLAYLLALINVILHEEDRYDAWFLKNRSTGPYLINEAQSDYLRNEAGKPLIWDAVEAAPKAFDDPSVHDFALEGVYSVQGQEVSPAFHLLKQGTVDYTPEWAEEITTVPAANIRTQAKDLLDNALIGSTIVINGSELPLRPACVFLSRGMTNHRDGHVAFWTAMLVNQLIGAVAVPGGNVVASDPGALTPDADGVVTPENFHTRMWPWQFPHEMLQAQEFVPYGFDNAFRVNDAILEPERYQADYKPEMFISVGANYFNKAGDPERTSAALREYPFIATFSYHIDEHALFADLVIPDSTYIEQAAVYNFDMYRPGHPQLVNSTFGHRHVIDPVFDNRWIDEVWMDVAERMEMLYGPGQLIFLTNIILGIRPDLWLDLGTKPTQEEVIDRWLRTRYGDEMTLDAFAESGFAYEQVPDDKVFNYSYWPGNQTRHPLFNIYFKRAGDQMLAGMREAGIEHPGWDNELIDFYYRGIPQWRATHAVESSDEFDLLGVLYKTPEMIFDVSGPSGNPWSVEAMGSRPDFARICLNAQTARDKNLAEGDEVYVENRGGVKIGPYPVHTTELLHPDCLGIAGGNGHVGVGINPRMRQSIPYNRLLSTDWDAVDVITGAIDTSPRLKITRA